MVLSTRQEERRQELMRLQADHKRWFSWEEFVELQELSNLAFKPLEPDKDKSNSLFKLLFKPDWFKLSENRTVGFAGTDVTIHHLVLDSSTQKIFIKYGTNSIVSKTFFLSYQQAKRDGIINLDNLIKYLK